VTIGVPFAEEWYVASGGRSTLVNSHWSLDVQRDAIDFVQLVDGKPYHGDRSRLANHHIFGDPLPAVADGRVTEAVDSLPDLPVGGRTWEDMAGNHVVVDIGNGRYVLYGHMKEGSLRVRSGDAVRRGQVIGQVGDSGNSDAPHLHIQVQNRPVFDVEDRDIRTYPILLEGATVADLRRGDLVRPVAGGQRERRTAAERAGDVRPSGPIARTSTRSAVSGTRASRSRVFFVVRRAIRRDPRRTSTR
jgi:hypothetical protein